MTWAVLLSVFRVLPVRGERLGISEGCRQMVSKAADGEAPAPAGSENVMALPRVDGAAPMPILHFFEITRSEGPRGRPRRGRRSFDDHGGQFLALVVGRCIVAPAAKTTAASDLCTTTGEPVSPPSFGMNFAVSMPTFAGRNVAAAGRGSLEVALVEHS